MQLQALIKNESSENREYLIDKKVQTFYNTSTKILIPIHEGNHFSLLEFIKDSRRWIHYDSNKNRREGGNHQRLARDFVCKLKIIDIQTSI